MIRHHVRHIELPVAVMNQTRDTARAEGSVAVLLRQTRQIAGLDLAEVSRALRIRRVYLEAIETGRYDALPGAPYVVGFVRAYAEHLRLNGDQVVRRLREETPLPPPLKRPDAPRTPQEGGAPKGAVLVVGAILALSAYGGWYFLSSQDSDVVQLVMPVPKRLESAMDQPPAAEDEIAPASTTATERDAADESRPPSMPPVPTTPDTTVTATANGAGATTQSSSGSPAAVVADDTPAAPDNGYENSPASDAPAVASGPDPDVAGYGPPAPVILRATADCWIEVRDDTRNRLVFARLLTPGDTYSVAHRPGLSLLAGNAGGLEVIVDGVNRGTLGRLGEVRRNVDLDLERLSGTAAAAAATAAR